jgi:hypothetical protein
VEPLPAFGEEPMTTERALTDFQLQAERALVAALAEEGFALTGYELTGESETCVHARVAETPVELYLYEDAAGILSPDLDLRFDGSEHESAEQLTQAFVSAALGCALAARPEG